MALAVPVEGLGRDKILKEDQKGLGSGLRFVICDNRPIGPDGGTNWRGKLTRESMVPGGGVEPPRARRPKRF